MNLCIQRMDSYRAAGITAPQDYFNAFEHICKLGRTTEENLREKKTRLLASETCHSSDTGSNPRK